MLRYFMQKIDEEALYVLDEPERSLSNQKRIELAEYIRNSAKGFGCQFIIATHSVFFLSMPGAVVYDLDSIPVCTRKWTELPNVRVVQGVFYKT